MAENARSGFVCEGLMGSVSPSFERYTKWGIVGYIVYKFKDSGFNNMFLVLYLKYNI